MSDPIKMLIASTILLGIPWLVRAVDGHFFGDRLGKLSAAAVSAVMVFALGMCMVLGYELVLDARLASFDLNGDGVFSGREITPGQIKAMDAVVHDTGRTLAPLWGAILCFVYWIVLCVLWVVAAKLKKLLRSRRPHPPE